MTSRCLPLMAVLSLAGLQGVNAQQPDPPSYLGEDMFWRCREGLVFHLVETEGTAFDLEIVLRDMNVYQQGPRPALVWLIGPDGRTVSHSIAPDDGAVSGEPAACDGVSDMFMDLRYREWHRVNSPGGIPPGKHRSIFLEHPERIPARRFTLSVTEGRAGLYRLVIVGGWDTWASVIPSKPLAAGIHPGPGPLYVHGNQLARSYIYIPSTVNDVTLALTEEVAPFSWKLTLRSEAGEIVGSTTPRSRISYLVAEDLTPDSVAELALQGQQPGACLHLAGVPFVLCPDAATARTIHGGMDVDAHGRSTFHAFQRTLLAWAYGLEQTDLDVTVPLPDPDRPLPGQERVPDARRLRFEDVPALLASQDLDPASPSFGQFSSTGNEALNNKVSWRTLPALLGGLVERNDEDNPYHRHPALVRRLAVQRIAGHLLQQAPYFWYGHKEDALTADIASDTLWSLNLRSNWYPMHDGRGALPPDLSWEFLSDVLPAPCVDAWLTSLRAWALCRSVMQQGECSNQWAAGLRIIKDAWVLTEDRVIEDVLRFQIERFTTPGNLGRVNPDPTPFDGSSKVSYAGRDADAGMIGGWVASDGLGHDNEYCLESTLHMANVWESLPHPAIERWLEQYYVLKTHLTMPKSGNWPTNTFGDTCSPTDFNHRTCCYTHKSPLGKLRPHIPYGDIWAGTENAATPWPCLENGAFTRVIDNQYYFIKTDAYYAILFGGTANPDFANWTVPQVANGSAALVGYGGMHYTGTQRKPTKIGGISAVWVPDCGPVWLSQNLNVMMSNTVWGRRKHPVADQWEQGHVDPFLVCSGFATPQCEWDAAERRLVKTTTLTHAPLRSRREVSLRDRGILVNLHLEATAHTDLESLYESLPLYATDRSITLYDAALQPSVLDLPPVVTSSRTWQAGAEPGNPHYGEDPESPVFAISGYTVTGPTGAGAAVLFATPQRVTRTRPLRYRSVAAATASLNVILPNELSQGDTANLRYAIVPFTDTPTVEELTSWRRTVTDPDAW